MDESDLIGFEDFVKPETQQGFIDMATVAQNTANIIEKSMVEAGLAITAAWKGVPQELPKTTEAVKSLNVQTVEAVAHTKQWTAAIYETRQMNKSHMDEVHALNSAYEAQVIEARKLAQTYKDVAITQGVNSQAARDVLAAYLKQANVIKQVDYEMGNYSKNVGNYTNSIHDALAKSAKDWRGLYTGIRALRGASYLLSDALGVSYTQVNAFRLGIEHATQAVGFFQQRKADAAKTEKTATEAVNENTIAQGRNVVMTDAMKAAQEENNLATKAQIAAEGDQIIANEALSASNAEVGESWYAAIGPVGLLVGGLVVLGGVIAAATLNWMKHKKELMETSYAANGAIITNDEVRKSYNDLVVSIVKLNGALKVATGQWNEYQEAVANFTVEYQRNLADMNNDGQKKLNDISDSWSHFFKRQLEIEDDQYFMAENALRIKQLLLWEEYYAEVEKAAKTHAENMAQQRNDDAKQIIDAQLKLQEAENLLHIKNTKERRIANAKAEHKADVDKYTIDINYLEKKRAGNGISDEEMQKLQTLLEERAILIKTYKLNEQALKNEIDNEGAKAQGKTEKEKFDDEMYRYKKHWDEMTTEQKITQESYLIGWAQGLLDEGELTQEEYDKELDGLDDLVKKKAALREKDFDEAKKLIDEMNKLQHKEIDDVKKNAAKLDVEDAKLALETEENKKHPDKKKVLQLKKNLEDAEYKEKQGETIDKYDKMMEEDKNADYIVDPMVILRQLWKQQEIEKKQHDENMKKLDNEAHKEELKSLIASGKKSIEESKKFYAVYEKNFKQNLQEKNNILQSDADAEKLQLDAGRNNNYGSLMRQIAQNQASQQTLQFNMQNISDLLNIPNELKWQAAPAFYEGTEDTGAGGGIDGMGGFPAILHPHERVIPADINEKLEGISNNELGFMLPKLKFTQDMGVHYHSDPALLNEVKELKDIMKRQPFQQHGYEDERVAVSLVTKDGQTNEVVWHKNVKRPYIHPSL